MNATFKVVFNKARGALMVVNEATSCVQAKGTKTVVAATAAALVSGWAMASALPEGPITNTNLPTFEHMADQTQMPTTKLVTGNGQLIVIETNGSVGKLIDALKEVKTNEGRKVMLKGILDALGTKDGQLIMTGVTGGRNIASENFKSMLGAAVVVGFSDSPEFARYYSLLNSSFETLDANIANQTFEGDTQIQIGGNDSNPLVIGVIGSDLVGHYENGFSKDMHFTRNGKTHITASAGNTLGIVGGNLALQVGDDTHALTTTLTGTDIKVEKTANAGALFGGSVAVAGKGAKVTSNLVEGSTITVATDSNGLDGLVVGGMAGGLAVAVGSSETDQNKESVAVVNNGLTSTIDLQTGEALGMIGGGAALAGDIGGTVGTLVGKGAGKATSTSGNVVINAGKDTATAALMGGGLAFADAYGNHKADTQAHVDSATINLEGDKVLTSAEKSQLVLAGKEIATLVKGGINALKTLDPQTIGQLAKAVDIKGVHVANLGGGIAIGRSYYQAPDAAGTVNALADVDKTTVNLNGGYNVATAAGGLAAVVDILGYANSTATNKAEALSKAVELNITGGENVLVSAGGIAVATIDGDAAARRTTSEAKALARVETAEVTVTGGSVDGLYGGGIAVDDTAHDNPNALADTGKVTIDVQGGLIKAANVDPIVGSVHGVVEGAPSRGSYVYQTANLLGEKKGNAAVMAGGMATGGGAEAKTAEAVINLTAGKVVGNVFGGGAATLDGKATVEKTAITVAGADVTGNIYAGGLAGSPDNEAFTGYHQAESTVGTAVLNLTSGTLTGDVLTGGYLYEGSTSAKVAVTDATVNVGKDFVFAKAGALVDGTGAAQSTLAFAEGYDFANTNAVMTGFDKVTSKAQVKGLAYRVDNARESTFDGLFELKTLNGEGTVNVAGGKLGFANEASVAETVLVTVTGGTFDVTALGNETGVLGQTTLNGGNLEGASGQFFTTALAENGLDVVDSGAFLETGATFTRGTLSLNDAKWNLDYANSAAAAMKGEVSDETKLVFTGTLVHQPQDTGTKPDSVTPDNKITVENAGTIEGNLVMTEVTLDATAGAESNKHNLVIGTSASSSTDNVIDNNLGVKDVTLSTEATQVTVNNGRNLTMVGGGEADQLIKGSTNDLTLTVGSDGSLGMVQLGVDADVAQGGVLTAAVEVKGQSQLNVVKGDFAIEGETKLDADSQLTVTKGGKLTIHSLATGNGGLISLGEIDEENTGGTAGHAVIKTSLGGNRIFLDPVFQDGIGIAGASSLVYGNATLNDKILVGQNSYTVFGAESDRDIFLKTFAESGNAWSADGVSAAVYLSKPLTLTGASGGLTVDGSKTTWEEVTSDTVTFADKSLLVADASKIGSGSLISAGTITVDAGSKAILTNVTNGSEYKLVSVGPGWTASQVKAANAMFEASAGTGAGQIQFVIRDAGDVYGNAMQGTALANAALAKAVTAAEYKFADALLSDVTGNKTAAAARFDAAMSPAGAVALYETALDRAMETRSIVRTHNVTPDALWVDVTTVKADFDELSTGAQDLDVDTEFTGVTVGKDIAMTGYNLGFALTAGSGKTDNDAVSGRNDFDVFGVNLYGRTDVMGVTLTGDAGLTFVDSDIEIGAGDTKTTASADTTIYSIGLEAKKDYAWKTAVFTPFVGLDVYHLRADGYTTNHGVVVDKADATTVEMPIGVRAAADFALADGTFLKPAASLAVIPTIAGDDIDVTTRYAGASGNYNFTSADAVKTKADLGIEMGNKNMTMGVNAGYVWGDESRSGFSGTMNLKFMF